MTHVTELKHRTVKQQLDKTMLHLDTWITRSFMSDTGLAVKSSMILMTGNAGITIDLTKKTTQQLIDALEKHLENISLQESTIEVITQEAA